METIIEVKHKGFVIKQFDDNHAELYDEGKMVARFSCTKEQSVEELKSLVEYYIELRAKRG